LNRWFIYQDVVVDFQVVGVGKVVAYLLRKIVVRDKALVRQAVNAQASGAISDFLQ
jgi:hypothetical protein